MIDQSHNLKNKIEAMIQTVDTVQELYSKASLVDYDQLISAQTGNLLIEAENCLKDAFFSDVRPAVREWRRNHGLPENPRHIFCRAVKFKLFLNCAICYVLR